MQNVGVVVAFLYLYFIFFLPSYQSQKQSETHLHPLYWQAIRPITAVFSRGEQASTLR